MLDRDPTRRIWNISHFVRIDRHALSVLDCFEALINVLLQLDRIMERAIFLVHCRKVVVFYKFAVFIHVKRARISAVSRVHMQIEVNSLFFEVFTQRRCV